MHEVSAGVLLLSLFVQSCVVVTGQPQEKRCMLWSAIPVDSLSAGHALDKLVYKVVGNVITNLQVFKRLTFVLRNL